MEDGRRGQKILRVWPSSTLHCPRDQLNWGEKQAKLAHIGGEAKVSVWLTLVHLMLSPTIFLILDRLNTTGKFPSLWYYAQDMNHHYSSILDIMLPADTFFSPFSLLSICSSFSGCYWSIFRLWTYVRSYFIKILAGLFQLLNCSDSGRMSHWSWSIFHGCYFKAGHNREEIPGQGLAWHPLQSCGCDQAWWGEMPKQDILQFCGNRGLDVSGMMEMQNGSSNSCVPALGQGRRRISSICKVTSSLHHYLEEKIAAFPNSVMQLRDNLEFTAFLSWRKPARGTQLLELLEYLVGRVPVLFSCILWRFALAGRESLFNPWNIYIY